MGEIYCLMCSTTPLNTRMQKVLFQTARTMLMEKLNRKGFLSDDFDGVATTSFKETSFGQISGIIFSAEIETERKRGRVVYMVNPRDIETSMDEIEWMSLQEYIREARMHSSAVN